MQPQKDSAELHGLMVTDGLNVERMRWDPQKELQPIVCKAADRD